MRQNNSIDYFNGHFLPILSTKCTVAIVRKVFFWSISFNFSNNEELIVEFQSYGPFLAFWKEVLTLCD